jgi:hypothetical protein
MRHEKPCKGIGGHDRQSETWPSFQRCHERFGRALRFKNADRQHESGKDEKYDDRRRTIYESERASQTANTADRGKTCREASA